MMWLYIIWFENNILIVKYSRQNEENLYGKALTSTYKGVNCTGKGFVKVVNVLTLGVLLDRELCHVTLKPIGDKEGTLNSFMA